MTSLKDCMFSVKEMSSCESTMVSAWRVLPGFMLGSMSAAFCAFFSQLLLSLLIGLSPCHAGEKDKHKPSWILFQEFAHECCNLEIHFTEISKVKSACCSTLT